MNNRGTQLWIMVMGIVLITTNLFTLADNGNANNKIEQPFLEGYFYPRSIIVAFTYESVGDKSGKIIFSNETGIVQVETAEYAASIAEKEINSWNRFNTLAKEHKIINLKQLHQNVTYPDWNDEGVYIQNIYRIVLDENDNVEEALQDLQKQDNVIFAEYETINRSNQYYPTDPMLRQQWHHNVIETPYAWEYVKGDKEIIIGISDTGTKWNHPDLADNIFLCEAELPGVTIDWENGEILGGNGQDNSGSGRPDDVMGWDFFHNNNNPYQNFPGNHHGTHVAGIAAAVGDNEVGLSGVMINASLMIGKGASSYAESEGVRHGYQMIQYMAQAGADIVNCSWGGPGNGGHANSIVNYATNLGTLVVAAAGNENMEHTASYRSFPANADNAMNIAALTPQDVKARFSDYGNDIDVSAPGVNIWSTYGDDEYYSTSGTSMAAPIVAGVAGLVKSLHPNLTPQELRQRIVATATYIDDVEGNESYVEKLGAGRVNAFTATMYDKIPKVTINDFAIEEYEGDGDGVPNPGETIDITISLANEIFWQMASDVTATLSTDREDVEMLIDTVPVPNIEGGSVSFVRDNPLRFTTAETLSDYIIPFTLDVYANQDSEFPYQASLELEVELSLQKAGWPFSLEGSSTSPALITDISGDGLREIVFGDSRGNLHVLLEDQSYLPGFPVNLATNINAGAAVADLNGNNRVEIVANTLGGIIYCIDNEGETVFDYDTGGQLRNNPMLVDVSGDGNYEIIVVNSTNPRLFLLNADGSDYPGFPVELENGTMSAPASADLNDDGNKEIVFVDSAGELHAISVTSGENITGFPKDIGAASWSGPTVGDVSGNGKPEIAVATIRGEIFIIDGNGNRLIKRVAGSPIRTDVLVFDLNNNGSNELIFADMSGRLFVTDNNGEDIDPFPINVGASIEASPVIADITRDLNNEIIFGDGNGYLHSINMEGNNTPNFPVNLRRSFSVSPSIGYVGEVDYVDILIPNQNGYQYVDFKRPSGTIGWRTFKGNVRRSGNNFDMTSVEGIDTEPQPVSKLRGNYPNPFNPNTTISFTVGESSASTLVDITVYNIRGQAVSTLINDKLEPGNHEVIWDGRCAAGREAASGVYFYRFQAEGDEGIITETRKMMLLK